jgi:hypothetical protein
VFSYLALYQSKRNIDLFIAASVCLAPMALSSMGAVMIKVRLMRRRILQRRAAARAPAAHASRRLTPAARRAALRMLVGRFVLQHDQLNFDERKGENDRHRHESYAYMIGILCEVRPMLYGVLQWMPSVWPFARHPVQGASCSHGLLCALPKSVVYAGRLMRGATLHGVCWYDMWHCFMLSYMREERRPLVAKPKAVSNGRRICRSE